MMMMMIYIYIYLPSLSLVMGSMFNYYYLFVKPSRVPLLFTIFPHELIKDRCTQRKLLIQ